MSRPRSAIFAIVEAGGIAPGVGSGPGRRLASLSQSALPAGDTSVAPAGGGAAVTSLAPDGDGSTGETDTETGAMEEAHPATVSATTSSANTTRVLIETP
jgi:hypothetical protein